MSGSSNFSKKHGTGSGLVKTDELDFDFLAEFFAGMVDDDHRTVAQVGNTLVWIAADGNDFNFRTLAGEILVAKSEGEDVQVKRIDMLGGGDFGEVIIVGQDEAVASFGKFHETVVDWSMIELVIENCRVEKDDTLEFAHGVETGTSAQTFLRILTVGEKLELVRDAARNDNVIADEAGFGDFNEARVHQGGCVDVNFAFLVGSDERVFAALERQNRSFPQNNKHNDKHT